jgi:SAM-dependent methyltransferase
MNIEGVPEEWQVAINKLLVEGSVLDLCCGSGRFYPLFQGREYTGVDWDVNFQKTLAERWPEGNWIEHDVIDYVPDKRYDNIFAWVALQHIHPDCIGTVAEMMKKHTSNILMCERMTGADPGDSGYLWKHDYASLFPGVKPVKQIVTDVWLMHWVNAEPVKKLKEGVKRTKNGLYHMAGKGFIKEAEAFQ